MAGGIGGGMSNTTKKLTLMIVQVIFLTLMFFPIESTERITLAVGTAILMGIGFAIPDDK